jgi:hypothetical protein
VKVDAQDKHITYLGITDWRNIRKRFGIKDPDRLFHLHVIGRTGTGKSTLLQNMVISDMQRGKGVAVLDPHSDMVERLLHYVPKHRINDVVYFNATDDEFPIGFNPLADVDPKYHYLVASGLISTFKKVFADAWGVRLEHTFRFALLTLLAYGDATLLDIQPLLTNEHFRKKVLSRITNPHLLSFWVNEHGKTASGFRAETVLPILNKLGIFVASIPLRNIFGQAKGKFTIQNIMDSGKILLVNLSKGAIGEDASALLGSVLVSAIQNAALFRATQPEEARRPFYAYIDEVQIFATNAFCEALSECRKYELGLCLAHQFADQLQPDVRSAIIGNVGTTISFGVGITDAKYLAKAFYPIFEESDFINLPKYSMYLRLMIDGQVSKPFSAISLPLAVPTVSYQKEIIARSREKYAGRREEVEQDINHRTIVEGGRASLF